jgi:hypothetical protein
MKYKSLNQAAGNESKPTVRSYDTSYEHSLEHHVAVRRMVEKPELGGAAVFAVYPDLAAMDNAVDSLREAGFRHTDISVLLTKNESAKHFACENQTNPPEAAQPATSGSDIADGFGWLAGNGAHSIAGVGLLTAVRPIVSAPVRIRDKAARDGIADALVGIGVPEDEAKHYEALVNDGGVLLSLHAENADLMGRAKGILERTRANRISVAREKALAGHKADNRLPRAS